MGYAMNITNEIISAIDIDTEFEYKLYVDGPWLECKAKVCNDCILTTCHTDNYNCNKDDVIKFLEDNNLKPWLFL